MSGTPTLEQQTQPEQTQPDCGICLMPLFHHGTREHLPCGHSFHGECLDEYADGIGCPREHLRCPHCRFTPAQCERVADSLMGSAVSGLPTPAGTIIEVVDEAPTQEQPQHQEDAPRPEPATQTCPEWQPDYHAIIDVVDDGQTQEEPPDEPDYHASIAPHLSHRFHPADVLGGGAGASSSAHPATPAAPQAAEQIGCGGAGVCAGICGGKCNFATPSASKAPPSASILAVIPWKRSGSVEALSAHLEGSPGQSPVGDCHVCGKSLAVGEGKIISRAPICKLQCKECKRVDQAVGRLMGSVQWVRELPFDNARNFYSNAREMTPKQMRAMCMSTINWQDMLLRGCPSELVRAPVSQTLN